MKNNFKICDNVVTVQLTQGFVTVVNLEDLKRIANYRWFAVVTKDQPYVVSRQKGRLHRFLTKAPIGFVVDHINGDTLDNRRCNLRICSQAENVRNSSVRKTSKTGYKGVSYRKDTGKYRVRIYKNYRCFNFGHFDTLDEAVNCYNLNVQGLHGPFAKLNDRPKGLK